MRKSYRKEQLQRRGKRWLTLLMCLCMVGTIAPVTVKAESGGAVAHQLTEGNGTPKTINLDVAVLRPESTWSSGSSIVYYGTYNGSPMAYRVLLSPDTQTVSDSKGGLLLDCNTILLIKDFDEDGVANIDAGQAEENQWVGSDLQAWLNGSDFYGNGTVFSDVEKEAMASTALAAKDEYLIGGFRYKDYAASDNVFLISAAEANQLYAGTEARIKNGVVPNWWMRSAYSLGSNVGSNVGAYGYITVFGVKDTTDSVGVSPAFNVKLSSVLLASAGGADKLSGLAAVSDSDAAEWKLTLLDAGKKVSVTAGEAVSRKDTAGNITITVPYTYGGNGISQISVMITDKAYTESGAQILYYGALQDVTIGNRTGTGTFVLPEGLPDGYRVYVIAEDVNGSTETDYASMPYEIAIPEKAAQEYMVTVNSGSGSGAYAENASVTITASPAPQGRRFKDWTGLDGLTIVSGSATEERTTFTMPAKAVTVSANYEAVPDTEYTITATAGANGAISPAGAVKVAAGGSQTFTITPSPGYEIVTLRVDGIDVTASTSYTFRNVNENHTIDVTFKQGSQASGIEGAGGSDNPDTPNGQDTFYQIISNANSSWMLDSSEGLTISGSRGFEEFIGVKIDGSLLSKEDYSAGEGATTITLNPAYLNTLAPGSHTFEILWRNGSASTHFVVLAKLPDNNENDSNTPPGNRILSVDSDKKDDIPKTEDNTPVVWLFILTVISGTGTILLQSKKTKLKA